MLKLQQNKSKKLTFEIEVGGIEHENLNGYFRFALDGIEYGFPLEINKEQMTVEVPALSSLVSRQIQEHEIIDARVDIIGNGYYINPWKDTIKISNPISIQSKLIGEEETPEVKLIVKEENDDKPRKPVIKESKKIEKPKPPLKSTKPDIKNFKITKEQIFQYMEKNGTRNPQIQELVFDAAVKDTGTGDLVKVFTEIVKQYKKKDIDKMVKAMRKK